MRSGSGASRAGLGRPPLPVEIGAQLWRNLPGLLGANLIFLVWCLPGVLLALVRLPTAALLVVPFTVGPGLAGLMTHAARLSRGEPAPFWRASRQGTRDRFWAASAYVAVAALGWRAHGAALATVAGAPSWGSVAMWAGELSLLALAGMAGAHVLSLIGLYGQGIFEAVRNALVLSARCPGTAAAMLGLGAGAAAVSWTLGGAPLIILPAALAICWVNNTLRLVRREGLGA